VTFRLFPRKALELTKKIAPMGGKANDKAKSLDFDEQICSTGAAW
jgi:hypothetical protein